MSADIERTADSEIMENDSACGTAMLVMLFGGMTMVLIMAVCAAIFGPAKPPEFEVISVSVSPFNVSTSTSHPEITANWKIVLSVRNPEKQKTFAYDQFDVEVSHGNECLAGAAITPFQLKEKQRSLVKANITATSAYVSNQTAQAIEYDLSATGALNFDVTIRIKAYVYEDEPDVFKPDSRIDNQIRASCDNLLVRFLSNNNIVGAMLKNPSPIPCKITEGHRLW